MPNLQADDVSIILSPLRGEKQTTYGFLVHASFTGSEEDQSRPHGTKIGTKKS
jgi:hypothetical protein